MTRLFLPYTGQIFRNVEKKIKNFISSKMGKIYFLKSFLKADFLTHQSYGGDFFLRKK
jgi:ABC-type enterochelin transport system permease subunit